MNTLETTPNLRTLAQRLAEGTLPVPEALRYAMILAEALRKIHDSGGVYGAVAPTNIEVTASGLELIPAPAPPAGITPYTAPEVLQGRPVDSRTDVFAFGATVYEMLTGRRAFEGDNDEALSASLTNSVPAPSGSAAVDRLIAGCVAKDPAARWQRLQKVILELKLLSVAARRSEAPGRQQADAVRAEMERLEARIAARLQAHAKAVADMQEAATSALNALREHLATVDAQLATALEQSARAGQGVEAAGQRIANVEQGIDTLTRQAGALQNTVAADFQEFEQTLKAQAGALASVRTAMGQTDDLVERVVEALESLQTSMLDQSEDRLAAANY